MKMPKIKLKSVETIGLGVLAGSGLNSLGAKLPIPALQQTAFLAGTLPVTYNDIAGAAASGVLALYGHKKKRALVKTIGLGMILGVALNKTAQYYGYSLANQTAFRMVNNGGTSRVAYSNMSNGIAAKGIETQINKGRYTIG